MKIYALATVQTGVDLLRLIAPQVPLSGVVGLADRPNTDAISGYTDMAPMAEGLGIAFIGVEDYSLGTMEDRQRLLALDIDLLFVCGWQRLIPRWLIDHCTIGAIGIHGSPWGITKGRGRSPQNWAIICGAPEFEIAMFFLTPGVDAGPVISTRAFPLTADDDIASSYLKSAIMTAEMFVEAVQQGRIHSHAASPQSADAYYLPQRLPEDGQIDWKRSTTEVLRFIRALTRPYPGAFSFVDGTRITLWTARPFDMGRHVKKFKAGEIILHASGDILVVATGDGMLIVDNYEVATNAGEGLGYLRGRVFESCDFAAQMQAIIARHLRKHPEYPLSSMMVQLTS